MLCCLPLALTTYLTSSGIHVCVCVLYIIGSMQIPHVPDIPTLPNLTKIALSDNSLTKFPTAINGASLPHLKVLSLRRCICIQPCSCIASLP